jgi:hypothetical protein
MASYEEFLAMGVVEPREFLGQRGQPTTGTKQELVARSFVCWEKNVPVCLSTSEEQQQLAATYEDRWMVAGLPYDPLSTSLVWKDSVSQWPKTDLGKIFHFVVSKNLMGLEFVGKYKSQKAYSYWASGFVDKLEVHLIKGIFLHIFIISALRYI